jgi:hypothetical protein
MSTAEAITASQVPRQRLYAIGVVLFFLRL